MNVLSPLTLETVLTVTPDDALVDVTSLDMSINDMINEVLESSFDNNEDSGKIVGDDDDASDLVANDNPGIILKSELPNKTWIIYWLKSNAYENIPIAEVFLL